MTTTDDAEMVRLTIQGFQEARARVAAAPETAAEAMFIPLTEASWWAICVDEAFDKAPGYRSKRNTSPEGQTVAGLHYARSALGHHRTFIAELGPPTLPFTLPARIEEAPRWVHVEDLPTFDEGKWARQYYVSHVAERTVLETLADADAWFRSVETLE